MIDLPDLLLARWTARRRAAAAPGSYPLLVRRLQEHFEATAHEEGRRPVLLLDESHELRPDVLGMLRILTNYDMDSRSASGCGETRS